MVFSITSQALAGSKISSTATSPSASQTSVQLTTDNADVGSLKDTSRLSVLSAQLSDSAAQAAARDSSLSSKALGAKASELLSKIAGDGYFANKAASDAEVPDTEDLGLLARAQNATQFVNGSGKNPFSGMSREQLSLISYDDSGRFTVNERRAAWIESSDQEFAWRQKVVANSIAEYNGTGKLTTFFTAALEHFKDLSPIEQAQYPDSYKTKLQDWIALDFNYKTHKVEGNGSVIDVLNKVLNLDPRTFDNAGLDMS